MAERIPIIYNPNTGQFQEVETTDEINVGIVSAIAFSNLNVIDQPITLASTAHNYVMFGPVAVSGIGTVIVGSGVSYAII
jgi:hypothetical protein